MKKNWTMRVGALMLALTLITSCFVGGTFAKYVTADEGSDRARVAKFGVQVEVADDSMFETSYKTDDTKYAATLTHSVNSSNSDAVVAPGTKSGDNAMKFSISGTPEVAVKVDFALSDESTDIFLKQGKYTANDYTGTYAKDTEFTLSEDYHPVVFTLKLVSDASENITEANPATLKSGSLDDISKFLSDYVNEKAYYAPGEKLDATFELSWEWAFEQDESKELYNKADTLLGDLAADKLLGEGEEKQFTGALVDGKDFSTEINYDFTITVTQID